MSETNEINFGQNVLIKDEKLPRSACEGIVIKTSGGAPGTFKIMLRDGSTLWVYRRDLITEFPPNAPDLAAVQAERDAYRLALQEIKNMKVAPDVMAVTVALLQIQNAAAEALRFRP